MEINYFGGIDLNKCLGLDFISWIHPEASYSWHINLVNNLSFSYLDWYLQKAFADSKLFFPHVIIIAIKYSNEGARISHFFVWRFWGNPCDYSRYSIVQNRLELFGIRHAGLPTTRIWLVVSGQPWLPPTLSLFKSSAVSSIPLRIPEFLWPVPAWNPCSSPLANHARQKKRTSW